MKYVKEKRLDELVSKLIRLRSNYQCEAMITSKCEGTNGQMQCSHFFSRRNRSTRFDPSNAACHCASCHRYLGGNPVVFSEWINQHLGMDAAADLRLRAHTPLKRSQPDIRDLHHRMKEELKYMQARRNDGDTSRIEFVL